MASAGTVAGPGSAGLLVIAAAVRRLALTGFAAGARQARGRRPTLTGLTAGARQARGRRPTLTGLTSEARQARGRRPTLTGLTSEARQGIGRKAAQQLARRELSRSIYQKAFTTRILNAIGRFLDRLLGAGASLPGGWWTSVALLAALVLVVAAVVFWIRPGRSHRGPAGAVLGDSALSAADHRALADRRAADGDYTTAIIERMRAVAVLIEERGVLSSQPGRTADELASQAASAIPELAADLAAAARLFDDVMYGGRAGTAPGYEQICRLDAAVRAVTARRARPVVAGAPGDGA
jgi:Domain of unknown function (DUF4129)